MKKNKYTITLALLITISVVLALGFQGREEKIRTLRVGQNTLASAAGSVTLPTGTIINVTGTAKITRIALSVPGRIVYLVHAGADTLVDGVNLKLAGDFNGTAGDVLTLIYSPLGTAADTFWYEVSRSAN